MSQDIYLRAAGETTLMAALRTTGMTVEAFGIERVISSTHVYALDLIGTLHDDAGRPLPGHHANLRWLSPDPLPGVLASLAIDPPAEPMRRWA
jgi:hypothetical protein